MDAARGQSPFVPAHTRRAHVREQPAGGRHFIQIKVAPSGLASAKGSDLNNRLGELVEAGADGFSIVEIDGSRYRVATGKLKTAAGNRFINVYP